jgi:serine/tyrosine/threonine adenylyltransferase
MIAYHPPVPLTCTTTTLYHLTRAGALVTSDTLVQRDLFYTGDIVDERATIVLRVAPTFLRFGSFEIFKGEDEVTGRRGPSVGNKELLKQVRRRRGYVFALGVWWL